MSKLLCTTLISLCLFLMIEADIQEIRLPVLLPPIEVEGSGVTLSNIKPEWGSCLFYMENLGIAVFYEDKDTKKNKKPAAWPAIIEALNPNHRFGWTDEYVKCIQKLNEKNPTNFVSQNFTFVIDMQVGEDIKAEYDKEVLFTINKGNLTFTLNFETVQDFGWKLTDVVTTDFTIQGSTKWLSGDLQVTGGSALNKSVERMEIGAYFNYTYGCQNTTSAMFATDQKDVYVGIFFGNVQIQSYGYQVSDDKKKIHFSRNTNDCVGTFTHGSFMGIIVALLFASGLIFAFMMLNSVKTLDRLDDPRQKRIFVNVEE